MAYSLLSSGKLKSKPERTTILKNLPQIYDVEFYTLRLGQMDKFFDLFLSEIRF